MTPGPGTYLIPRSPVPCTKISPMNTTRKIFSDEPLGPGCYFPITKNSSPRWGFGSSNRHKLAVSESPGPGSYNINNQGSTKGFSLFSRRDLYIFNKVPGPGAYNPKTLEKSLKFSLGKKIKYKIRDSIPGPGTYSPMMNSGIVFSRINKTNKNSGDIRRLTSMDFDLKLQDIENSTFTPGLTVTKNFSNLQ